MSRYIFLFDLDATITKQQILPAVAKKAGMYEKMISLTESTARGEIPFKQSFLQRVELLKEIPVSQMCNMVGEIPVHENLADFIRKYRERCYIVTGHLDIWIKGLVERIGMEHNLFCSKALVQNDYIQDVLSIVDKYAVVNQMILPFVAVGEGNHDAEMIEAAEIGIGYGGVRDIAPAVLACASHAVYREEKLVEFLERLV